MKILTCVLLFASMNVSADHHCADVLLDDGKLFLSTDQYVATTKNGSNASSLIYTAGSSTPFAVSETPEEVLKIITMARYGDRCIYVPSNNRK